MAHSFVEIYLHVIFSTKNRLPLIPHDLESRLYSYFGGIARKRQVLILKVNGMSDHIHMMLKLHASVALSLLMKELKSYSMSWMKTQGVKNFSWQEGYGAFSCSVTHVEALSKYIENQKEHHRTDTFDQEIGILNKLWGIKWMVDTND